MKVTWEYLPLKKSIHKTYNYSFLIIFFDHTFKILIFNKFDKNQFNFKNDQNLSIFSQYDVVNNFDTVNFDAKSVKTYFKQILLKHFSLCCF